MHSQINPYSPPRNTDDPTVGIKIDGVTASCTKRGWISRTITLTGTVEAVVRYRGWGFGERVYVDGTLAARTRFFSLTGDNVTPHIDFMISTADRTIPASIDVSARAIYLLRLSNFSLTLCDTIVYAE